MESSGAKTWVSALIGALVGAGLATASAYMVHVRVLEQIQARLQLEELNHRRRIKRAKRIATLHNSSSDNNKIRHDDGDAADPDMLAAAAATASIEANPAAAERHEDSFSAGINEMPAWLPRVQTHCKDHARISPSPSPSHFFLGAL